MAHGRRRLVLAAAFTAGTLLVACSSSSSSSGSQSGTPSGSGSAEPIVIGISLSQTGDFSDPGQAAMRGYQLWADTVNANGGILGRQVELKIADDASDPNQAVTNYQNFISKDKVDLVFGPFSTLLSVPSAQIANRYGYSFVEPAGGGPMMFDAKLPNVFFVQPAPVLACGQPFVDWVLSLPADQQPKTAAYVSLDDPFASPIADEMQKQFEAAGITTVYQTIYPPETTNLTPIVSAGAAKNPDMWIGGTQSADAYGQVKSMISLNFNPKFLYLSNGANSPVEFPSKVGSANTEGIFSCGDWFPNSKASGNQAFIDAYTAQYGGDAFGIDSTSAEAYAVGQLIEQVAAKTGSIDNATIISSLHSGSWPTVEGDLSWDQYGQPQGSDMLVEWIDQKLVPVYPPEVGVQDPVYPKPNWAG
jgi:branched-chain amino acid transport system substrate-binding protein